MPWLVSLRDPLSAGEVSVSLHYPFEHGSFMVRHVGDDAWGDDDTTGFVELMDRDQVIGTQLAECLFHIVHDLWLTEPYVQHFVALVHESQRRAKATAGSRCRESRSESFGLAVGAA